MGPLKQSLEMLIRVISSVMSRISRLERVLFHTRFQDVDSLMSRHFFHLYCSVKQQAQQRYEVHIWGRDFSDWDATLNDSANIAQKFGQSDYFDVIVQQNYPTIPLLEIDSRSTLFLM